MTTVTAKFRNRWAWLGLLLLSCPPFAQGTQASGSQDGPAVQLYLQLSSVGLDPAQVYRIHDFSFSRSAINIALNDGEIAFTHDVAGHITGALFEGDGEILLPPPNQVERASLTLFTGAAILEESFSSAYFRFNDDSFSDLRKSSRPAEDGSFADEENATAKSLAQTDALRVFLTLAQPQGDDPDPSRPDRYFHARIQGRKLGAFDVFYDSQAPEQISAGQIKTVSGGQSFYDTWMSFSAQHSENNLPQGQGLVEPEPSPQATQILRYEIQAEVKPPTELSATAVLFANTVRGGSRTILFELSRSLHIDSVEADGHPIEFIHNQAIDGSQISRRGNDLVAVVFPQPLIANRDLRLRFIYHGDVLADAGGGLLSVGSRGIWYPNFGLTMANYDLTFTCPKDWTLIATGKRVENAADSSAAIDSGAVVSHWASERPIPVAGFNLGRYKSASVQADGVRVSAYAASNVEKDFPIAGNEEILSNLPQTPHAVLKTVAPPQPSSHVHDVANLSAQAISFFSKCFGPFPYSSLSLAQMPGTLSQGWPGLIYLSSHAFLSDEERTALHMTKLSRTMDELIPPHEIAHQWWGDLVGWNNYRDQWLVEALANYSALLLLESRDPAAFQSVMEAYREALLQKNDAGLTSSQDGPVTLGTRLSNSQFPDGYETISYGRGTWLLHMLRCFLRDAEKPGDARTVQRSQAVWDEPFVRALHALRNKKQAEEMTTRDLIETLQEELPHSAEFEGKKSLEWFIESWINGSSIPRVEVKDVKITDKAIGTSISFKIEQSDAPETLVSSVPIYGLVGRQTIYLGRIFADGSETNVHLSGPAGVHKILLDPNHALLTANR